MIACRPSESVSMQEVKSHERSIISFRQITNSQLSRTHVFRVGISHVITSITAQPATICFVLFSLVLGSAIAFIVPPLRGPDEIAHFVRIYSYVHGELLPSAGLDGRKGTFVKRELHHKLYFFKTAGEQFAPARQKGRRSGKSCGCMMTSPYRYKTESMGLLSSRRSLGQKAT